MWITMLIVALVIIIDQFTKALVEFSLFGFVIDGQPILGDFFRFSDNVFYNTGAGYSILDNQTLFLAILSLVASVLFIYITRYNDFKTKKVFSTGIALCIGGTVGNGIDRFQTVFNVRKGVVDFLNIFIGNSCPFGTFNVADACLVIGVILIGIDVCFLMDKRGKKNEIRVQN